MNKKTEEESFFERLYSYEKQRNSVEIVVSLSQLECGGHYPYAVERTHMGEKDERTVLSVIDPNKKHKEYMFFCSRNQHNELVQQFHKFLENKK